MTAMADLVIRNGLIVDGSGNPAFRGDVAIEGDTLTEVGTVTARARRVLDAGGMVVSPASSTSTRTPTWGSWPARKLPTTSCRA